MVNIAHDLFLLMSNLSQLKNQGQVLRVFIEAVNSFHPDFSLVYHDTEALVAEKILEIRTAKNSFGALEMHGKPEAVAPEFWALLQNAAQMLAVILENIKREQLLENQNLALAELVNAKTRSLQESENLLREIAVNYPHSYLSIVEPDLTIGFTSGQEFKKQGLNPDSFIGLSLEQVFGEHTPAVKAYYLRAFAGEEARFELFINNQYQLYNVVPLYGENGQVRRILAVVENITERKQAEQQIKAVLVEKEMLLRELYHRTRNNMQVICSMLRLQTGRVQDERSLRILQETENRIHIMALVHQKLYQSQNLTNIDLKEYILDMVVLLRQSYYDNSKRISLVLDLESVNILFDVAIPCGLILNEMITNALLHAFPGDRSGEVAIRLHRAEDGVITLQVSDNGVGFPAGLDLRQCDTLGLLTIFSVGEYQLRGKIEVETGAGVTWRVRFKDNLYTPRV